MTRPHLLILEDRPERLRAMVAAVKNAGLDLDVLAFDNAPDFIASLPGSLKGAGFISLDHDLGPNRSRDGRPFDPGTGRDVSRALAAFSPCCSVVVASTNVAGGDGMEYDLGNAGWHVRRVLPYDDVRWVEEAWLPTVIERLT